MIKTGQLLADGVPIGQGYAGHPPHVCDPLAIDVPKIGPLPPGLYDIGAPRDVPESVGAYAMPLTPDARNVMFGRGGFYVHGDNSKGDQSASEGCIVTARAVREIIARHSVLSVVTGT